MVRQILFGSILVLLILSAVVLPVSAKATRTDFTCIETLLGFSDDGVVTFPNGNTHIRESILLADEWASDSRLIGLNTIVLNANLRADGTGPMWGTFRIENGEGGWEGTYAGHLGEWYNAVADGFGAYSGMKMWWNKYYSDCSGTILEH